MPDNPRPSAESEPQASPGEFDFAQPKTENPRMKRRSLRGAPPSASTATPAPASEPTPEPAPAAPQESPARPAAAEETPRRPDPAPAAKTFTPYTTRQPNPSTSPSSPLYYSSGARKEKEDAAPSPTPMKTSPSGATPSSSNVPASSAPFRSTTTPASSSASSTSPARGTSVVDYRANIERQSREQKSIGGVLSIIVYVLIGFFVISAALAGYGAYVLSRQIQQQSITVSDLDKRYASENAALNANLKTTSDSLIEAQAQAERQQELIVHQQETINQLIATTNKLIVTTNQLTANSTALAASLRQERQARASETAALRARVHVLEPKADQ
jgi:hypothetical protein